jgi:hypothetical protein
MQKLNDEFQRSFIVIMQDKLYGLGGNVVHEDPLNATNARKNKSRT